MNCVFVITGQKRAPPKGEGSEHGTETNKFGWSEGNYVVCWSHWPLESPSTILP